MTTNNNPDALFADAELPFGHPRRRFDYTPEGFDASPLVDQGPGRDYTPDEEGAWSTTPRGTGRYAATKPRPLCTLTTPTGCRYAKAAWSW